MERVVGVAEGRVEGLERERDTETAKWLLEKAKYEEKLKLRYRQLCQAVGTAQVVGKVRGSVRGPLGGDAGAPHKHNGRGAAEDEVGSDEAVQNSCRSDEAGVPFCRPEEASLEGADIAGAGADLPSTTLQGLSVQRQGELLQRLSDTTANNLALLQELQAERLVVKDLEYEIKTLCESNEKAERSLKTERGGKILFEKQVEDLKKQVGERECVTAGLEEEVKRMREEREELRMGRRHAESAATQTKRVLERERRREEELRERFRTQLMRERKILLAQHDCSEAAFAERCGGPVALSGVASSSAGMERDGPAYGADGTESVLNDSVFASPSPSSSPVDTRVLGGNAQRATQASNALTRTKRSRAPGGPSPPVPPLAPRPGGPNASSRAEEAVLRCAGDAQKLASLYLGLAQKHFLVEQELATTRCAEQSARQAVAQKEMLAAIDDVTIAKKFTPEVSTRADADAAISLLESALAAKDQLLSTAQNFSQLLQQKLTAVEAAYQAERTESHRLEKLWAEAEAGAAHKRHVDRERMEKEIFARLGEWKKSLLDEAVAVR